MASTRLDQFDILKRSRYYACDLPFVNRSPLPQLIEIILMVVITLFIVLRTNKLMMKYTPNLLGKYWI